MSRRSIPAARVTFSAEDRQRIHDLMEASLVSGALTLGPHTQAFEEAFACAHGAEHAIAVSSGTSALEIILRTIGVAGRDVVLPTNTFFATAAAVAHAGGRPRLADVAADTMSLSAATVEAAITPETAAVITVHIGGLISPEVVAIRDLCDRRGVVLIEDAAHAHGSRLGDRSAGSFGHAAAFSFYPTKVITSGEGGMILTQEEGLRDEARIYRDQGKSGFLGGDHIRMGYAWRMSELQAATGLVHLGRLEEFIAMRQEVAKAYDAGLAEIAALAALPVPPSCRSNFYKYTALLAPGVDRAAFKAATRADHDVTLSGEVYALPLHRQPVFESLGKATFPTAEDVCSRHVCLPVHSDMTVEEARYVVDAVAAVASQLEVTR